MRRRPNAGPFFDKSEFFEPREHVWPGWSVVRYLSERSSFDGSSKDCFCGARLKLAITGVFHRPIGEQR